MDKDFVTLMSLVALLALVASAVPLYRYSRNQRMEAIRSDRCLVKMRQEKVFRGQVSEKALPSAYYPTLSWLRSLRFTEENAPSGDWTAVGPGEEELLRQKAKDVGASLLVTLKFPNDWTAPFAEIFHCDRAIVDTGGSTLLFLLSARDLNTGREAVVPISPCKIAGNEYCVAQLTSALVALSQANTDRGGSAID